MAEYIERETLAEEIQSLLVNLNGNNIFPKPAKESVLRIIDEQPTADVVEVVRCKDCSVPHNKWTGCPHLNGLIPPPNFYCAKGERSTDNA